MTLMVNETKLIMRLALIINLTTDQIENGITKFILHYILYVWKLCNVCTTFLDLEMELEQTEGSPRNRYAGEDHTKHDPVQGLVLVLVYLVIHLCR